MSWSTPHTAANKAASCTLGPAKLASKQPSWNKWTEQLQMETSKNNALSQSHCHETVLPERHSTVKGCERNTVKSEKYKVEVESFKPAQECQIKNSSLSFLPTGFFSSWITEQGCESQSTQCLFLSKIPNSFPLLPLYPFLTSPCPQASTVIMGFQQKLLHWELPLEILPNIEPNSKTSSCSGR